MCHQELREGWVVLYAAECNLGKRSRAIIIENSKEILEDYFIKLLKVSQE